MGDLIFLSKLQFSHYSTAENKSKRDTETKLIQTLEDKMNEPERLVETLNERDDNLPGIVTQYFQDDSGDTEWKRDKQHQRYEVHEIKHETQAYY